MELSSSHHHCSLQAFILLAKIKTIHKYRAIIDTTGTVAKNKSPSFQRKKFTISPTTSVRGIETCTKKKLHISRRPPRSVLVFVRVFQICCVFSSSVLKLQQQSRNSFISRWKKKRLRMPSQQLYTQHACVALSRDAFEHEWIFSPFFLRLAWRDICGFSTREKELKKKEKCVYSAFSSISNDQRESSHISICSTTSTKVRAVSLPPYLAILRLSRGHCTHTRSSCEGGRTAYRKKKSKRESSPSSSNDDDDDVDGKVECADEGKGMCGGTRERVDQARLSWFEYNNIMRTRARCAAQMYISPTVGRRGWRDTFFSAADADDSAQPSIAFACVAAASNGVSGNRRYRRRLLYAKSEWARCVAEY